MCAIIFIMNEISFIFSMKQTLRYLICGFFQLHLLSAEGSMVPLHRIRLRQTKTKKAVYKFEFRFMGCDFDGGTDSTSYNFNESSVVLIVIIICQEREQNKILCLLIIRSV